MVFVDSSLTFDTEPDPQHCSWHCQGRLALDVFINAACSVQYVHDSLFTPRQYAIVILHFSLNCCAPQILYKEAVLLSRAIFPRLQIFCFGSGSG